MNDTRLAALMRESTDNLPQRDLVPGAVAGARRIRRRRRIGGLVAVAVVVAVAASLPTWVPDEHHPVPSGPAKIIQMPPLSRSITNATFDQLRSARLPKADLGLPADLTPVHVTDTPPGSAVMVTKPAQLSAPDPRDLYALDRQGVWHKLHVDAPLTGSVKLGPTLVRDSLSPDGTTVVLAPQSPGGGEVLYFLDLATGKTRTLRVPPGYPTPMVYWQHDDRHLLVTNHDGQAFVLDTRTDGRRQFGTHLDVSTDPHGTFGVTYAGDTLIHTTWDPGTKTWSIIETRNGHAQLRATTPASRTYSMGGFTADDRYLATTASPRWPGMPRTCGSDRFCMKRLGLLVFDRHDYAGVAFLHVLEGHSGPSVNPVGWLPGDELLFTTDVGGGGASGRLSYYTWNIHTGELERVGRGWGAAVWATDLLR